MGRYRIRDIFTNPSARFSFFRRLGVYDRLSDEQYIKRAFKARMGYELDLSNPKTFNEKLQWLKLNDRNPVYHQIVDKYEAKNYFEKVIGSKYIIPTLGVWDRFEDIDFDTLPQSFVLKTTHNSGGVIICKDKSTLDIKQTKKKLCKWLSNDYYLKGREWPYKGVKPRIIAEEYLDVLGSSELVEYKIFCFNGAPRLFLVCKGTAHGAGRTNDFYDLDFNHIPVIVTNPNSPDKEKGKPEVYDELVGIAAKLAAGIPQVRVDTYVADGRIYIGEMTFFHDGGMCRFNPKDYDLEFGEMLDLPTKMKGE